MNRDDSEAAANVMLAYASGKPIQIRRRRSNSPPPQALEKWQDVYTSPSWSWEGFEYRIKPEPREVWLAISSNTGMVISAISALPAEGTAYEGYPYRRFVEDLEGSQYD